MRQVPKLGTWPASEDSRHRRPDWHFFDVANDALERNEETCIATVLRAPVHSFWFSVTAYQKVRRTEGPRECCYLGAAQIVRVSYVKRDRKALESMYQVEKHISCGKK